jgi:osmotically-inducible protein OsmY
MTEKKNRPDAELRAAVAAELEWTPSINSAHIGIAVTDGAVTLSGEAATYPEKLLAEKAALRVRGVTAVAEEITVRSDWKPANDTDIARESSEALHRAVDIPDSVKVSVSNHVVTLTGAVKWHHERAAAYRAVQYTRGVREVINDITVNPGVEDANIKSQISAAFVRNALDKGNSIRVVSDDDHAVTLEGTVGSWSELRQAEHIAWSAPGVAGVKNRIRIAP